MSNLLSRYAEAAFWMARYMERAENLARILDVNETFSRDSRGDQNWRSVLQLYADEARYIERNEAVTPERVIYFYTLDLENPGSIIFALRAARENARTLRPLISTEMWTQVNIFYNRLRALKPEDLSEPRLTRFCSFVKESCQTHTGVAEGTLYRDAGWSFYHLGQALERADQTTRLLDVKYHLLLPNSTDVGSPADVSQWNAVLRSAAGYHAYRRIHPSGLSPETVAGFFLFNSVFPRSVLACVTSMDRLLSDLRSDHGLSAGKTAQEVLRELCVTLMTDSAADVIARGLHQYLDRTQLKLISVTEGLARDFFRPETGAVAEGAGQRQA